MANLLCLLPRLTDREVDFWIFYLFPDEFDKRAS